MIADLVKKCILVTGAGAGIGNQLCKDLACAGAKVIAVARNPTQLEELCGEHPTIQPICVDLSDWKTTRERLADVPMLDGLVNNAGIAVIKPFKDLTEADYDVQFDVNIKAVFHVTQSLLPKLNEGASIVMLSSLAASHTFNGHSAYSATKAAVDSLTRSLAFELSDRKIRVNSIKPTVIMTKMSIKNWEDPAVSGPLLARIPLHRFGEVEEVVDAIVFLLGPRSRFINGHHLHLEGGYAAN